MCWYLRHSYNHRDLEEMIREWGLHLDHIAIYRWVQHYAPGLEQRCRPHHNVTNDSWRVNKMYIKVKKVWMYLYRALDSQGNTLEFLLSLPEILKLPNVSSRKRLLGHIPVHLAPSPLIKT